MVIPEILSEGRSLPDGHVSDFYPAPVGRTPGTEC
jgi:hypothetical protein